MNKNKFIISDDARIGHVGIVITDLERSVKFYKDILGLEEISQNGGVADLGVGGRLLLRLTEVKQAIPIGLTAGLYHFAILVPSRYHLALSLRRILEAQTPIDGFANHIVSESVYLPDPDGNLIEVYADRPKEEWHDAVGNLRITVEPLDLSGVMAELEGKSALWNGLDARTVMGHIHLFVSHLKPAENFYTAVLGFHHMADYRGSASFVAADGYHHHVGMNVWRGIGVPPAPARSVGLDYFTIVIPDRAHFVHLCGHIKDLSVDAQIGLREIVIRDTDGNRIIIEAEG